MTEILKRYLQFDKIFYKKNCFLFLILFTTVKSVGFDCSYCLPTILGVYRSFYCALLSSLSSRGCVGSEMEDPEVIGGLRTAKVPSSLRGRGVLLFPGFETFCFETGRRLFGRRELPGKRVKVRFV